MGYKVIHSFTDLQDFNHLYKVGDKFPRLGMNVSQSRIDELATSKNRRGKPLIEEEKAVDEFEKYMNPPIESNDFSYTKTEINRMSTADLKKLAKDNGIDDSLSGAELKKKLIEYFGL